MVFIFLINFLSYSVNVERYIVSVQKVFYENFNAIGQSIVCLGKLMVNGENQDTLECQSTEAKKQIIPSKGINLATPAA